MKLEVLNNTKNSLYDRQDVQAIVSEIEATPSRKTVLEELAKALGVKAECLVIDKIEQRFGRRTAGVKAKAYPTAEAAKKFEKAFKFSRTEGKKKAAGEAAAVPAPAPAEKK